MRHWRTRSDPKKRDGTGDRGRNTRQLRFVPGQLLRHSKKLCTIFTNCSMFQYLPWEVFSIISMNCPRKGDVCNHTPPVELWDLGLSSHDFSSAEPGPLPCVPCGCCVKTRAGGRSPCRRERRSRRSRMGQPWKIMENQSVLKMENSKDYQQETFFSVAVWNNQMAHIEKNMEDHFFLIGNDNLCSTNCQENGSNG